VRGAMTYLARHPGALQVRADAERALNAELAGELSRSVWNQCTSYLRGPGGRIVTQWPYTGLEYARRTRRLCRGDWVHRAGGDTR